MIDFFNRLDTYMNFRGLNDNRLTVECQLSNGIIGKARKRGALSQKNISKILNTYQEINATWLFTGEGEMLKGQKIEESNKTNSPTCRICAEKDETIQALKEAIWALRTTVEALTSQKSENKGEFKQTG